MENCSNWCLTHGYLEHIPSSSSWAEPKAGLMSCSRACMKSARLTHSFSAASLSTST